MSKTIGAIVAAVAALTLSGGAFAQSAGAGGANGGNASGGSTASPANQVNGAGGYGSSDMNGSGSGMRAPNSGLPSSAQSGAATNNDAPALPSNNTLATPSVASPAAHK